LENDSAGNAKNGQVQNTAGWKHHIVWLSVYSGKLTTACQGRKWK